MTVLGVSGTAEGLPISGGESPEAVLQPIAAAMNSSIDVSSLTRKPERNEQIFLMPPEMADILAKAAWDLSRVQDYLFNARKPYTYDGNNDPDDRPLAPTAEDIHPIITGGVGVKMTHLPLWAGGSRTVTRAVRTF